MIGCLRQRLIHEPYCSTYALTLQFDAQLRRMLQSTPTCLHPTIAQSSGKRQLPLTPEELEESQAARDAEECYSDEAKATSMRHEFQRHTHTLNVSNSAQSGSAHLLTGALATSQIHQSLLLIHRSWFVKSLHDSESDPLSGPYAKSVYAVGESSGRV